MSYNQQPAQGQVVAGQPVYQYGTQQQGGKQQPATVNYSTPATPTNDPSAPFMGQSHNEYAQEYITQGVPLYAEYSHTGGNGAVAEGGRKFVVQGYKDIWAAIFFLALIAACIGVGSYNFKHNFSDFETTSDLSFPVECIKWAAIGVGAGFVLGIVSLFIFYLVPKASIIGANILSACLFFGIAVIFFKIEEYYSGFVFCFVGCLRLLLLYIYRKLIPLSGLLLKQSAVLSKRHPMTTIVAFVTLLTSIVFAAFVFGTGYPTLKPLINGYNMDGKGGPIAAMIIFMAFVIFWSSQVAFNVGHTTFCGLVSTWYFCGQSNMPSNPTLHSAKRALTTSFGSICFGSLVVAIIRTIRFILRCFSGRRNILSCIAMCLLSCIEAIVRMFNHYAFVYVSMYGCGYVDGAKKTINLIKTSPFLPLFANLLIDGTLGMFYLVVGAMMGVVTFFINKKAQENDPDFADRSDHYSFGNCMVLALIAGLSAMVAVLQMFRVVDSTVTALLVCLSEEPRLIFSTNAEFANELAQIAAIAPSETNNDQTQRSMNAV